MLVEPEPTIHARSPWGHRLRALLLWAFVGVVTFIGVNLAGVIARVATETPWFGAAVGVGAAGLAVLVGLWLAGGPAKVKQVLEVAGGALSSVSALPDGFVGVGGSGSSLPALVIMIVVGIGLLGLGIVFALTLLGYAALAIIHYNFAVSLLLVLCLMGLVLLPPVFRRQTWKKLFDVWLKFPSMSSFAVMGFGVLGFTQDTPVPLVQIAMDQSQLPERHLVTVFLTAVGLIGLSYFMTSIGRAWGSEESQVPPPLFIAAFGSAWLANVAVYTLFIDGVILTLYAHLSSAS